jgi:hypothetical protein
VSLFNIEGIVMANIVPRRQVQLGALLRRARAPLQQEEEEEVELLVEKVVKPSRLTPDLQVMLFAGGVLGAISEACGLGHFANLIWMVTSMWLLSRRSAY